MLWQELRGVMTLKPMFEISWNVYQDNAVYNVNPACAESGTALSGALILHECSSLKESHIKAVSQLYDHILSRDENYVAWILVTTGGRVKPTRITEYFRLWKAFQKGKVPLPLGLRTKEYVVRDGDGAQYYGAVRPYEFIAADFVGVFRARSSSYLLLSKSDSAVASLLEHGWNSFPQHYPLSILLHLERTSDILMSTLGCFDDIEGGAVALASPDVIRNFFG
ncbi:hypothetical protein ACIQUF_24865 [Pseudomonas sp. NPDC090233]|uniref:hypothetical protein n=1 Tax=Pseudomonas sp. NPDC090233 TaxID=3364479 RepID=UPI00383B6F39